MPQFDLGDALSMPEFLGDGQGRPESRLAGRNEVVSLRVLPSSSGGAQLDLGPVMVGVGLGGGDAGADGPDEEAMSDGDGGRAKFRRRSHELMAFARQIKHIKQ